MIDCSYHFIDGKSQFLKKEASEADTGDNRFRISKRMNLGLNIRVENTCILLLSIYSKEWECFKVTDSESLFLIWKSSLFFVVL